MTRDQKIAKARKLREQGLLLREVAERMGLPVSSVHELLTDPDLSKHRERRMRYGGTCEICGVPTDGSRGLTAGPIRRCVQHNVHNTEVRPAAAKQRTERAIALRKKGLLNDEIAAEMGETHAHPIAMLFARAHRYGLEVPPSPYRGDAFRKRRYPQAA